MPPKTQYEKGDVVNYKPVGGPQSHTSDSVGTIRNVITESANLTGRNVHATQDEPRYDIENNRTHKHSAIAESNIIGPAE